MADLAGSTTCRPSRVSGRVVDVAGEPYKNVTVSGRGGTTASDQSGNFTMTVDRGAQALTGIAPGIGGSHGAIPKGTLDVDATQDLTGLKLMVKPAIYAPDVTIKTAGKNIPAYFGGARMTIFVAGLPLNTKFVILGEGLNPSNELAGGSSRLPDVDFTSTARDEELQTEAFGDAATPIRGDSYRLRLYPEDASWGSTYLHGVAQSFTHVICNDGSSATC